MAERVVGLMIVEECVRAAEVLGPSSRHPVLVGYGETPLPPGAAGDSEVIDSDAVALALQQLWSDAKFSTSRVVLGLGNRRILVRDHTVPKLPLEQLRKALPFQVQDLLPMPVDEAVLDFYPLAEEGDQARGLLVAAVAEMVSELIGTVRKAKLSVGSVDLAPFGLVRAASRHVDPEKTVMLCHVGAHTSYLVVMRAGAPLLVRIVPGGVPLADPEVARHRAEAEQRQVEEFAMRVRSTVDFFVGRTPGAQVEELWVCGEGGQHEQVLPTLDHVVGIPSKALQTDMVVGTSKGLDLDDAALSLVTPIGLALGGQA